MAANDPPPHDDCWHDATWRSRVRKRLLDWFAVNARQLPWRDNPAPYRVWVSEIMLQQTQVATVIPYFERFLAAFPTVHDLAESDEQTLLSHWEGLGYYRRARSLHAAARMVVVKHHGIFPDSFADVIALPGVGRYTAGAILSISQDIRLPILEGNTRRVFSRWAAVRGSTGETQTTDLLWQIAEAMLPRRGAGTFNQAAMELGRLVCTPSAPRCDDCPVRACCRARRDGLQDQIPGKVSRIRYEDRTEFALVIPERLRGPKGSRGQQRYLVRALPEGGRWGGLWDFPRTTNHSFDNIADAASELEKSLGVAIATGIQVETIKHAVTKFRISLHVYQASLARQLPPMQPWCYLTLDEMAELPMSVTGRRIVELIRNDTKSTFRL